MQKSRQVLVIDCRTREMNSFFASVTQVQVENSYQLVVRQALEMGSFSCFLSSSLNGAGAQEIEIDMPIIIMGSYSAFSSAGYVSVHYERNAEFNYGYRQVLVVGGLGPSFGKKGLRILGTPIQAVLIRGPLQIKELWSHENSNCSCADAARLGVQIMAKYDIRSVYLCSGQSDYSYAVRFVSYSRKKETKFPQEHRQDIFSSENIIRQMIFTAAYHDMMGERREPQPTEEALTINVRQRVKAYLAAKAAREEDPRKHLGRAFACLHFSYQEYIETFKKLGLVD